MRLLPKKWQPECYQGLEESLAAPTLLVHQAQCADHTHLPSDVSDF